MSKNILIFAANPSDTARLRLSDEVREIEKGLQRSANREQFSLNAKWAVQIADVRQALLEIKPNVVHFCGHGEGAEGLVFENWHGKAQLVKAKALAGLFKLFADSISCVLLNACYSHKQAEAIAEHIDYVIGMEAEISDKAAIVFSVAFYDAILAGETVEFAFKIGLNALALEDMPEESVPVLIHQKSAALPQKASVHSPVNEEDKTPLSPPAPELEAVQPPTAELERKQPASSRIIHRQKTKHASFISSLLMVFCLYALITGLEILIPKPATHLLDFSIRILENYGETGQTENKFLFADIDDATYQAWNQSIAVSDIQALIEFALQIQAKIVVVDIDLGSLDSEQGEIDHLAEYLTEHAQKACGQGCPQLIFLRNFKYPPKSDIAHLNSVIRASPNMALASFEFCESAFSTQEIATVRRHNLWKLCPTENETFVLAVELLVAGLLKHPNRTLHDLEQKVRKNFNQPTLADCQVHPPSPGSCNPGALPLESHELFGGIQLSTVPSALSNRIFYKHNVDEVYTDWLEKISAHKLYRQNAIPRAFFESVKIFLIGATFREADNKITPLGKMPGSLIITNSVYSLLEYGQMHTNFGVNFLLGMGCIGLLVFLHNLSTLGKIMLAAGSLCCFLLSLILLQSLSYWFSPIAAIASIWVASPLITPWHKLLKNWLPT